ncbi:MAG: tRNA-splicing endonuclease [Methanomassiliicoccales archaeon PtaB.Bin134]|jgi:tRNA-intron endonuclease|nr:MAG: tRNA-splicing endonuclease [Methanomassiliicoccales archaeon PtaB.Bin134]
MAGELVGDSVIISEMAEGSQIYNKGYYGYPRSGGGLELDLLEALYLLECEKLQVQIGGRDVDHATLYRRAARSTDALQPRYIVYRDLRQRGYIVKVDQGDFNFRVYPRGASPHNSQAKNWVLAISERDIFNIAGLLEKSETSQRTRKDLLLGVVDEEGDITYYTLEEAEPGGHTEEGPTNAEGALIDDAVIVLGAEADRLYENGFYGKKIGPMLQLSLLEAVYLMEKGRLDIRSIRSGQRMGMNGLLSSAKRSQPDFDMRMSAYKDLRSRGMVVKTGFKYGTHFRVYEGNPSKHHSRYLVHVVPDDYSTVWAEISRAVRLAHGVKKEILLASSGQLLRYVKLTRVRP